MAGSVNKVILIGNLGDDPKIISGSNGKFAELSVATSESWRDKTTGERREVTDWHRVKVFAEPLVKFAEQYLKKGTKVYVEGKQKTRKWTDEKGVTHYSTDVVLNGFGSQLSSLQGGGGRSDSPDDYGTPSAAGQKPERRIAARGEDLNDDIPF